MAFKYYVDFKITVEGIDLEFKNAETPWGKFYKPDCNDERPRRNCIKSDAEVDKMKIKSGNSFRIGARGRERVVRGTEGSFELWEDIHLGKKVGSIFFDCPRHGDNKLEVRTSEEGEMKGRYRIIHTSIKKKSTGIGRVDITILKLK